MVTEVSAEPLEMFGFIGGKKSFLKTVGGNVLILAEVRGGVGAWRGVQGPFKSESDTIRPPHQQNSLPPTADIPAVTDP